MATATILPQQDQPQQANPSLLATQQPFSLPLQQLPLQGVPQQQVPPAGVMSMPMHPPSASLYVGDLLSEITEAMLFEIFNQVGAVSSIRVCRDAVTRRSLGYAYVNFHNVIDAERAIDTLNYAPIKGRPCRIMWSQRDPALRKSGVGNIFIKNLDVSIDNKALHDTFSAFGTILSCKVVAEDAAGTIGSKGYGFVHYDTMEAAELAIKRVDGMLLNGKKVFVGLHVPRRARESKVDEMKARFTNVFLKNLDESLTDDELRALFEPYGTITSLMIARDENGKSRGFGFINFDNHDHAIAAVESMNNKEVNGKPIFAGRAQKKGEREEELRRQFEQLKMEKMSKYQGVNLYVKNLDDTIDDEKLRQEFSVFGTITSARVMRDDKGASKGFGFVCFSAPEEATKAVTEANGRMIGNKPIYVALAQKRDIRRAHLEIQYAQRSQMRQMPGPGQMPPNAMYGGAPMFYGPGGVPPHAQRPNYVFQQPMMVRPRFAGQVQPMAPGQGPQGNVGPHPGVVAPGPGQGPNAVNPQQGGIPVQHRGAGGNGGERIPGGFPGMTAYGGPNGNMPRGMGGNGMPGGNVNRQGGNRRPNATGPTPSTSSSSSASAGAGAGGMMANGMARGNMNPSMNMAAVAAAAAAGGPQGGRRGNFKYGPNARNTSFRGGENGEMMMGPGNVGMMMNGPPPHHPGAIMVGSGVDVGVVPVVPLTAAALAAAPLEQQKRMLGERLFPLIAFREPQLAGKITGMLLEMDNEELLMYLETPEALNVKVDEAVQVLSSHEAEVGKVEN